MVTKYVLNLKIRLISYLIYLSLVLFVNNQNSVVYSWVTSNKNPYMCSSKGISVASGVVNHHLICAQDEFPPGSSPSAPNNQLTCASGNIECFVFAGYGRIGGSCAGDEFKEDPSGIWTHIPNDLAEKIIGKSSFKFSIDANNLINGVTTVIPNGENSAVSKLKVVAYCSGENSNNQVTTNGNFHKLKISFIVLLYLIFF